MSEITRKPLFSFEEVEEELAKQREQIAQDIETRKLIVIEQSKVGLQPEEADFYREIIERSFDDAAATVREKSER